LRVADHGQRRALEVQGPQRHERGDPGARRDGLAYPSGDSPQLARSIPGWHDEEQPPHRVGIEQPAVGIELCLDDRATLGGLVDLETQDPRAIGVLEHDDAVREWRRAEGPGGCRLGEPRANRRALPWVAVGRRERADGLDDVEGVISGSAVTSLDSLATS
jgi:hypothetical protein